MSSLLEEATSETHFLVHTVPRVRAPSPRPPTSIGDKWPAASRGRAAKLSNMWMMCKGISGAPDHCLLCRLRQGTVYDIDPPKGQKDAELPKFQAGTRRPRLLERAAGFDAIAAPPVQHLPPTASSSSRRPESPMRLPDVVASSSPGASAGGGVEAAVAAGGQAYLGGPPPDTPPRPSSMTTRGLSASRKQASGVPDGSRRPVSARASAHQAPSLMCATSSSASSATAGAPALAEADLEEGAAGDPGEEPSALALEGAEQPPGAGPPVQRARPKSALWRLSHRRTREERMAFVDQSVRLRLQSEATVVQRDLVNTTALVLEALADFGIKAENGAERTALVDLIVTEERGRGHIDFPGFCGVIEEGRAALRLAISPRLLKAFKNADIDDEGVISRQSLWQVLQGLGLAPPRDDEERQHVQAVMDGLDWDKNQTATVQEAEHLVVEVRQFRHAERRRKEREVVSRYAMSRTTAAEFRGHLGGMYEAFVSLDDAESGVLDSTTVLQLLADFGCLRGGIVDRSMAEEMLRDVVGKAGVEYGAVDFAALVSIVGRLRSAAQEGRRHAIEQLFEQYDRREAGKIAARMLPTLLVELDLLPRTIQQQAGLAQFFEDVEAEGITHFTLQETVQEVQKASERLLRAQREAETQFAFNLRFTRAKVYEMRSAFEALDTASCETLSIDDAFQAIRMLGIRVPVSTFRRIADENDVDNSGTLDFMEFMQLVRRTEDDCSADEGFRSETAEASVKPVSRVQSKVTVAAPPASESGRSGSPRAASVARSKAEVPGFGVAGPGNVTSFRQSARSVSRDRQSVALQSTRLQGEALSAILVNRFTSREPSKR